MGGRGAFSDQQNDHVHKCTACVASHARAITRSTEHVRAHSSAVRFLVWLAPGDFAEYFKELFALFHAEPSWPPLDPQKLASLIAKYDQLPS
jgi:hypothetical protein